MNSLVNHCFFFFNFHVTESYQFLIFEDQTTNAFSCLPNMRSFLTYNDTLSKFLFNNKTTLKLQPETAIVEQKGYHHKGLFEP